MNKDTIYREDAIKAMEQRYEDILHIFKRKVKIGEKAIVLDMIGCVKNLPSADRLQGKWILLEPRYPVEQKVYWNKEQALADTKGNGARERRKCSCCGYIKSFICHMKDEQIKLWNFCPNCGAKMKGVDDE